MWGIVSPWAHHENDHIKGGPHITRTRIHALHRYNLRHQCHAHLFPEVPSNFQGELCWNNTLFLLACALELHFISFLMMCGITMIWVSEKFLIHESSCLIEGEYCFHRNGRECRPERCSCDYVFCVLTCCRVFCCCVWRKCHYVCVFLHSWCLFSSVCFLMFDVCLFFARVSWCVCQCHFIARLVSYFSCELTLSVTKKIYVDCFRFITFTRNIDSKIVFRVFVEHHVYDYVLDGQCAIPDFDIERVIFHCCKFFVEKSSFDVLFPFLSYSFWYSLSLRINWALATGCPRLAGASSEPWASNHLPNERLLEIVLRCAIPIRLCSGATTWWHSARMSTIFKH